jgi:hypothetical protein
MNSSWLRYWVRIARLDAALARLDAKTTLVLSCQIPVLSSLAVVSRAPGSKPLSPLATLTETFGSSPRAKIGLTDVGLDLGGVSHRQPNGSWV